MKMLYIASTFSHLKSFHIPYIKALRQQGWQLHLAGAGSPIPEEFFSERGIDDGTAEEKAEKESLEAMPDLEEIVINFRKKTFSAQNINAVNEIHDLLIDEKYDCISVHTSLAAFYVRLAVMLLPKKQRPRVVNTVHGYLFDKNTNFLKKQIYLGAELLTRAVTEAVVVMNRQDFEIARKYKLGKKIIMVKGYGYDGSRFKYEHGKVAGTNEFTLIYAAEFSKRKNQEMLIEAMEILPDDVRLILAGKGKLQEKCKKIAKKLGVDDRVKFVGHVNNLEMLYGQGADICVSSSRSEGLPFNIMEAMASGLPIIASRIKGHEDLIPQEEKKSVYHRKSTKAIEERHRQEALQKQELHDLNKIHSPQEMWENRLKNIENSPQSNEKKSKNDGRFKAMLYNEITEFGLLYPYNDVKAFARAVIKYKHVKERDPIKWQEMKWSAAMQAKDYCLSNVMGKILAIYEDFES